MKKTISENQVYAHLAKQGDPSAFYALFHDGIRDVYALQRSRGQDHEAACGAVTELSERMYRKFLKRRCLGNPQKWFVSACGLKKFCAVAAKVSVSIAEADDCERRLTAALNRAYSDRLDKGSDGKGNLKSERGFLRYAIGAAAVAAVTAFLFFSESVLSVKFGRFGEEYKLSFPGIAESLWQVSGLVRAGGAASGYANGLPAAEPRPFTEGAVGGHE